MFHFDFAAKLDRGLVRAQPRHVARVVRPLLLALVGGDDLDLNGNRVGSAADRFEAELAQRGGFAASAEEMEIRLTAALSGVTPQPRDRDEPHTQHSPSLVALTFAGHHAVVGHIGGGACLRLRGHGLDPLAQGATDRLQVSSSPFEVGDVYLLCSAGVRSTLSTGAMVKALSGARNAREACDKLLHAFWQVASLAEFAVAIVRLVPEQLFLEEPREEIEPSRAES